MRQSLLGLTSYIPAREGLSNNAGIAFVRQGSSHSPLEHAPLHQLALDVVVQPDGRIFSSTIHIVL